MVTLPMLPRQSAIKGSHDGTLEMGPWRQDPGGRNWSRSHWNSAACWLDPHCFLSLASYTARLSDQEWHHPQWDGLSHINHYSGQCPQTCLQANLMEAFSQLPFPFLRYVLDYVKGTKTNQNTTQALRKKSLCEGYGKRPQMEPMSLTPWSCMPSYRIMLQSVSVAWARQSLACCSISHGS